MDVDSRPVEASSPPVAMDGDAVAEIPSQSSELAEEKVEAQKEVSKQDKPDEDKEDKGDKPEKEDKPDKDDKAEEKKASPVKKRGGSKPILKVSGIARIDNNLKPTLFQVPQQINQKNYFTDYLKRDEQLLFYRQWTSVQKKQKEQAAKAKADDDEEDEEDEDDDDANDVAGARTIVIHPGSRNLRLGLASQAFPRSVPSVIAHRIDTQDEDMDMEVDDENDDGNDESERFTSAYNVVYKDFRERMRFYKRRIIPNSHDLVVAFNGRQKPTSIPEHNDVDRINWTDVNDPEPPLSMSDEEVAARPKGPPRYFTGIQALNIPPDSSPRYSLKWPIQHGTFNEQDYDSPQQVLGDMAVILLEALEQELTINHKQFSGYNVVLIIPDLYDKSYVNGMIELILEMGFGGVCIQQESMAATFGAGISTACIIDVGAQKTSITCVEDGMCISDSRVNLKYGGDDITRAFAKLLLRSNFPYKELDLKRSYDWTLAEQLKEKFATTNDADIAIQLYSFFQRAPNEPTFKYDFKLFDEAMIAPLGLFYPELFELDQKLASKYKLFPRAIDIYDDKTSDPLSDAQINVQRGTLASNSQSYTKDLSANGTSNGSAVNGAAKTTTNGSALPVPSSNTPNSSVPGTPVPESVANAAAVKVAPPGPSQLQLQQQASDLLDPTVVAAVGLDHAIIESVTQAAAKSTLSSSRQVFYESLMVIGGGASKFPGMSTLLTDRIAMWKNSNEDLATPGEIQTMAVPREMDPSIITWKGGSVLAKLKIAQELWITASDWDLFGSRSLQYKALFAY